MKASLIAYARSLGFERIGFTSSDPLGKDERFLLDWIKQGRAGDMHYLERRPERRATPQTLLPGARTVIMLATSYGSVDQRKPGDRVFDRSRPSCAEGKVARYARGEDYHKVIRKRLGSFIRYVETVYPGARCRSFVDTGPLLERAFARKAGLGFIGKNTMLITRTLGSWVFLASVVTTATIEPDEPDNRNCGSCRLCIDACPTHAITAPFELEPRRCISYLTIESQGVIDPSIRSKTDGWIFGCDICQEVCPHNVRDASSGNTAGTNGTVNLAKLLTIQSEEAFARRFAGSPLRRAGRAGLLRNACVASANHKRLDLLPLIEHLAAHDRDAVVREHAAWAVDRLKD